jgi:hypothetical protein
LLCLASPRGTARASSAPRLSPAMANDHFSPPGHSLVTRTATWVSDHVASANDGNVGPAVFSQEEQAFVSPDVARRTTDEM